MTDLIGPIMLWCLNGAFVFFVYPFKLKRLSHTHAHTHQATLSNCVIISNHPTLTTGPFDVTQTRTLSGFRSRWVIPRLCKKATALQSCWTTAWLCWLSGGLESRNWFKSPPSQYSITSHRAKQCRGNGGSSCLCADLFLPLFWGLFGVETSGEIGFTLSWSFAPVCMVLVLSWSPQTELDRLCLQDWECFLSWFWDALATLPFITLSTSCTGSFPGLRGFSVLGPVCRRQLCSAITLMWFWAVALIAHISWRYSSIHSGLLQGSRLTATFCPVLAIWPSKTTP